MTRLKIYPRNMERTEQVLSEPFLDAAVKDGLVAVPFGVYDSRNSEGVNDSPLV